MTDSRKHGVGEWVMVPKVPSREMLEAYEYRDIKTEEGRITEADQALAETMTPVSEWAHESIKQMLTEGIASYRAMLASAPLSPKHDGWQDITTVTDQLAAALDASRSFVELTYDETDGEEAVDARHVLDQIDEALTEYKNALETAQPLSKDIATVTDEMVERGSIAIWQEAADQDFKAGKTSDNKSWWPTLSDERKEQTMGQVRAAIEAALAQPLPTPPEGT